MIHWQILLDHCSLRTGLVQRAESHPEVGKHYPRSRMRGGRTAASESRHGRRCVDEYVVGTWLFVVELCISWLNGCLEQGSCLVDDSYGELETEISLAVFARIGGGDSDFGSDCLTGGNADRSW